MSLPLNWLIIANGEPLPAEQLLQLAENKAVMMLDGALEMAFKTGIQPQIVLGDFDSSSPAARGVIDPSVIVVHDHDQETTDLEKALNYLVDIRANTVTIANATGWRLDHSLYNLRLLKRFHHRFKSLVLMTAREQVLYLEDQAVILTTHNPPQPLALLSFPEAQASSQGLAYELRSLKLEFAAQASVSNALIDKRGEIVVQGGALLMAGLDVGIE